MNSANIRVITNSGAANGTAHTVHDVFGNVIAELDAAGATVREYIWLPEAEIAPTMGSRTTVDRPMAVVSGVNTTPTLLMVHVDHLHRPVKMTNAAGASVWSAVYQPWGGAHTITGAETLDARFPGQWFQLEAGLHYNWHRHYDPTLGRYTQPDPLGFVDGPSQFAYSGSSPSQFVDPEGEAKSGIPRRHRDCNSTEWIQCFKQCGAKGVESCKRSQMEVTIGTQDGKPQTIWKDQGLSCSCKEPEPIKWPKFQCNGGCKQFIWGMIVTAGGAVVWGLICVGS